MPKIKLVILLTVFIDVIGLGIVIPTLPFYVASFSNSAFIITSLFSIYALFSFFSAPIIGALSDRFGRRPMLILSIFSTAIGWFVFASATNIFFLFIGRIIDGIMAGNFPIAQSYLSDISKDDKERTTNLGLIGAIFGIAFILGPFLGGVLGHIGHSVPFFFVGGLALFNGILATFILEETNKNLNTKPISINPFSPIIRAVKNHSLRNNYLSWFLFGLSLSVYQAVFSLYLRDVFSFNELVGGIIFGIIGIVIAINQGLAMKHIWLKYFEEPKLELNALIIFAFGFILLSIKLFYVFCIGLLIITFSQSILRVIMTSQIVGQAKKNERGESLGILSSITSLGMMIGPFLSGLMYGLDVIIPFLFSSICLFISFIILYKKRKELEKMNLPEDITMESMV